ncbi:MAG: helix-turn-helix transcriptional regulator, partial [Rhizobiaceae bacterium]|nr:helix-turn-helix transcriptional regulator [Rhizobiaceae bacterium]
MAANAQGREKSETPRNDSYGEAFGERLKARATSFASRPLRKAILAVTELRYDKPSYELSSPPAPEDAYLVALHLKDYPIYEYWENGRAAPVSALRAGDTIIYDIKRRPTFHLNNPFHSVHYYFSRQALEAIADHAHGRSVSELRYSPAVTKNDAVMRSLTQALLPAFARPLEASRLFTENIMLAVGIHVACTYGDMEVERSAVRGGLAPWQEKRVKEILAANLDGDLSLATLAGECGLSASHFSRAFRTST